MGIGIGMIIASVVMSGYKYSSSISDDKIEEKARGFGMHYEDECKVLLGGDLKND